MEKAYDTACALLRHMNCQEILGAVVSHNTNRQPAVQDMKATQGARGIAEFFNGG